MRPKYKKLQLQSMWENDFLSFGMSPSHRNAPWHFAGRAAKPTLKRLRALLQGWLPENTGPGSVVKQKNIVFISGEHWQPKHVTKGRVCKTALLPLNPSYFLDRKNEVLFWLSRVFFLVTNSLQTLARSACCLPEGCAGSVRNISGSPGPQGVSSQWPLSPLWGCPLWSAGCWGTAVVTMVSSCSDLQCAWI